MKDVVALGMKEVCWKKENLSVEKADFRGKKELRRIWKR